MNEVDYLRGIARTFGVETNRSMNELYCLRGIVREMGVIPAGRTLGKMNERDCLLAIVNGGGVAWTTVGTGETYEFQAEDEGCEFRLGETATNSEGSAPEVFSAIVGPVTEAVEPPTPDLLWWKFNEGSGTTIAAAVGSGGTTDAAWVTGKSGSGFALDFTPGQSASSTAAVAYSAASKITVACWIYLDASDGGRVIAESSPTGVSAVQSWSIVLVTSELFTHMSDTSGLLRAEKIAAPANGAWRHLAVVYDQSTAAGEMKIYLDGALQSTTVVTTDHAASTTFADNTLFVGERDNSSIPYDGRIDDFRIYGTELTIDQIVAIMGDPQ